MKATQLGIIRQVVAALTLNLAVMVMGTMVGWPSPILHTFQTTGKPFKLTNEEISWMVAVLYLGNVFTSIPIGYLMDFAGRKTSILMLSGAPLLSWLLLLYAHEPIQLITARTLCGVWTATITTIVPMYLCEIAEPKLRGSLNTFAILYANAGIVFEYAVGRIVSYDLLIALSTIFPLCFVLLFWIMPESPYWLAMNEMDEEAALSLAWLRGESVLAERVIEEIHELSLGIHEEMQHPKNFKDLIATKGHRKALLIVQVLALLQRLSGISALVAFPSITLPNKNIGILTVNDCVLVMGSVWAVSALISTYLIDFWGRKPLLIISSVGCSVASFTTGLWFFLNTETSINVGDYYWVPFVGFVIYGVFYTVGLGPIPGIEQGEMFSANDRALASALTSTMLALASFVSNKLYMTIANHIGMYMNFWIFASVSTVCTLFVYFVVIETKGRTLYQIHQQLEQ